MTAMLDRPPPTTRPWWHLRPAEKRPLAWILGAGGPAGFLIGALLGVFLQTPGPALPAARQGMPGTAATSVAPPNTTANLPPTRPQGTGSASPARRTSTRDATRPAAAPPRRRTPDTPKPTSTVRDTPATTPTAPPETSTISATSTEKDTKTKTKDPGPTPGEGGQGRGPREGAAENQPPDPTG